MGRHDLTKIHEFLRKSMVFLFYCDLPALNFSSFRIGVALKTIIQDCASVTETLESEKLATTLAIIFSQFTVFWYRFSLLKLTQSVISSIKSSTHELSR